MGFVKDVAKVATFGLAGQILGKKKKTETPAKIPTMISSMTTDQPRSMIGSPRGNY